MLLNKWRKAMMGRYKWKLLFVAMLLIFLTACLFDPVSTQSRRLLWPWMNPSESSEIKSKLSIFSWSSKEVTENRQQLLNDLTEYKFDRIFQEFSSSLKDEEVTSFVEDMANRNIDVYGLYGAPEWAWDSTGKGMISRLNRLAEINSKLPEDKRIKGMVVDVEPYVLNHFDWNDQAVQESYMSGMKQLYEALQREGLELIVVIPYFFDTKGYKNAVETIIREASDEVAVMNYYRDHEIKHLSFEAEQAKAAAKPITTIYEFKRPGEHGLIDKNTYFNEGRAAAEGNARTLKYHYKGQEINIAYHDYKAFREVLNNE